MPLHKVLSVCYLHAEPRLFGYKYKRDEKIFNGGGCHSVYAGSILHQGRSAAVQGQLHLTIPVTGEGSLLETAYPVASVTVSGYAERYADALMFFPIIGIITGYLGDFVKSFPWIIAFSLGTSLIYAVTGRHGGADTRLWSAAKPLL